MSTDDLDLSAISRVRAWIKARISDRRLGFIDPVSFLAVTAAIAVFAGVAYASWPVFYGNVLASQCIANEDAISNAAELYHARVPTHDYPQTTAAVSASTFQDATGQNMLQSVPRDQSDRTGSGAYTFTNTSANGNDSYIISCSGTHPAGALQGLAGWTATSKTIYETSGQAYTQ